MSILAVCPSRGRPGAAAETLASFRVTRRDPGSRIVFLVDSDDPTAHAYPAEQTRTIPPQGSMGGALRWVGPDVLGDATSVGMVGDDNRFVTPGWDLILDGWLTANIGIAYGDDGYQHERLPTSWWLSRPIVDALGLCHPEQRHFYMDNYWRDLGRAVGCLRYFPEVRIEHLHPLWDPELGGRNERASARWDATYDRGHRWVERDKRWYRRWTQTGDEAATLRRIVRPEPRRVLADWHHPALWEALSLVIEDRFGWSLYSPAGREWKEHGWRLSGGTPGWTADDYLARPGVEPEYPERPRKTVTWTEFAAEPWDVIIASVGTHQASFAELARTKGARYVHHIGDARRRDARIRGAVVMASAVWPGATVTHHQEFDLTTFGYSPPGDPTAVSSLMLRLDDTSGPYRWLSDAPGIRWSAVECDAMRGPGYLAPMTAVAERMRSTGWIWQDKAGYRGATPGDGYGHVLFNAAAIGRPLIGHASHYAGQMGAGLWVDGETCIDLDRHTPEDALRRIRTIGPREHEDMSRAIRGRFDALVDFAAEAEAIRAALA